MGIAQGEVDCTVGAYCDEATSGSLHCGHISEDKTTGRLHCGHTCEDKTSGRLHCLPLRTRLPESGPRSPSVSSCWQRPLGSVHSSSPPVAAFPSLPRSRAAGPEGLVAWSWSSPEPPGRHNDNHLLCVRVWVRACVHARVHVCACCACMHVCVSVWIMSDKHLLEMNS